MTKTYKVSPMPKKTLEQISQHSFQLHGWKWTWKYTNGLNSLYVLKLYYILKFWIEVQAFVW